MTHHFCGIELKKVYKGILYAIIVVHYGVFCCFIMTCLFAFTQVPFYVYVTLLALIGRVITSREECPLTTLENKLCLKLGIPDSKGFMKDYILEVNRRFTELKLI